MKKLSHSAFTKSEQYILNHGRPLERRMFENSFLGSGIDGILDELQKYQNPDGGFGNGLEPDYRLPLSSPLATSVAFQHLLGMDDDKRALDMIKSGIKYLENTFIPERSGWLSVPSKVNDYPHAPWWHFNVDTGGTVIDRHWGNPSAEIIGYMFRYWDITSELDVRSLLDYAISYINNKTDFQSPHEVYCFVRLYELLPERLAYKVRDKLTYGVQQLVSSDRNEWASYVPYPLKFVSSPESYRFVISDELINNNLDYLIEKIEYQGFICPNWTWDSYSDDWERAEKEWIGVLTLQALHILDRFHRIDR